LNESNVLIDGCGLLGNGDYFIENDY